ncbi:MAG: hypothetical protein HY518_03300 [Candidatus Aenigmarchaeota archaeon]|nr:hypothetical protein [Candidatus Aenigmarchaeota archaeon]
MKVDIDFYLDGAVESRLPQLVAAESPLRLERGESGSYSFHSKDAILDSFFFYTSADEEIMSEVPLHVETQRALGIQPESHLLYQGCNLNPAKVAAFEKIMEYLAGKDIPLYMTATDEYGEEMLIRGYNPATDTEVRNPNFRQALPRLLE